jgi:hypothetical protein
MRKLTLKKERDREIEKITEEQVIGNSRHKCEIFYVGGRGA